MKRLIFVVIVAMAVSLAAGSAWAWDMDDHVIAAPNGKGDVLIFPFYAAVGGYQTDVFITNTSDVYSVVAKLEFRSPRFTYETRDFFIFLSPNDVFTAKIARTDAGVMVTSEDDSIIASVGAGNTAVWANNDPNGFVTTLPDAPCSDTTETGYLEVFEVAYYNYPKNVNNKVPKNTILLGYGGIGRLNDDSVIPNAAAGMYQIDDEATAAVDGEMWVGSLGALAGHMEVGQPGNALNAAVRPTALRNYHASLRRKLTLGTETFLGDQFAHNSTGEVEAALSKNELVMPYSHRSLTFHVMTFPTKKTDVDLTDCSIDGWVSPYFEEMLTPPDNCVVYVGTNYDMSETQVQQAGGLVSPLGQRDESTFCNEVNTLNSFDFDAGWTRYHINVPGDGSTDAPFAADRLSTCAAGEPCIIYKGVPVIGTVFDLNNTKGPSLITAAYTDTDVSEMNADTNVVANCGAADVDGLNTTYYYYQYWDRAHYPTLRDQGPANVINWGFRDDGVLPQLEDTDPWPEFPSVCTPHPDNQLP